MRSLMAPFLLTLLILTAFSAWSAPSGNEPLTLLNKPAQGNPPAQTSSMAKPDIEQLRDIYGPVTIEEPVPYLLLVGAAALLLIVAAVLFWFIRKRPRSGPPPVTPWDRALMDLAEARSLLTPEQGLAYMTRASNILRHYIEARFSIKSTRQTTREFLKGLRSVTANSPLNTFKEELQNCLEQADLAKFAHRRPEPQNLEVMEDAVKTFVTRTRPNVSAEEGKS